MNIQALKKLVFGQELISKYCTLSIAIRKVDELSVLKRQEGHKAKKHKLDKSMLCSL